MNVIFTALSKTQKIEYGKPNMYCYGNDNENLCSGYQQQEPGTKFFLANNKIDKIVILCSTEVLKVNGKEKNINDYPDRLSLITEKDAAENFDSVSTLDLYLSQIYRFQFLLETDSEEENVTSKTLEKDIEIACIKDRVVDQNGNKQDNLLEIINALKGTEDNPSKVFVDAQGGDRTTNYIYNSLLQLLSKKDTVYHTKIESVVSIPKFLPGNLSRIVNQTSRYQLVDLISGMDAFLNYGKASILANYIDMIDESGSFPKEISDSVFNLKKSLELIDRALTFNIIMESANEITFSKAIVKLKIAIEGLKKTDPENNFTDRIFQVLIDGIEKDFDFDKLIVNGSVDPLELVKWCTRHDRYIIAAVIVENMFPKYFVQHKILYYAKDDAELNNTRHLLTVLNANRGRNAQISFDEFDNYYVRSYVEHKRINKMQYHINNTEKDILDCYGDIKIQRNRMLHVLRNIEPDTVTEQIDKIIELMDTDEIRKRNNKKILNNRG